MNSWKKKLAVVFMSFLLMIMAIPNVVFASDAGKNTNDKWINNEVDEILSGMCGDNLTFRLDSNGTLTISGTGPMYDYDYYDHRGGNYNNGNSYAPWYSSELKWEVKRLVIKDGVTTIGDGAFADMEDIREISIANSVIQLGNYAFYHCSDLKNIVIPDTVIKMGEASFGNCTALTSISLSKGIAVIPKMAFMNTCINELDIPESVHSIESQAFLECWDLKKLVIPTTVEKIDSSATDYCMNLTIYGKSGSVAEQYASQNDIPFFSDEIFDITFENYDKTIISQQSIQYGHNAVAPEAPCKKSTEQYEYVFLGWDRNFNNVRSDLVVTAVYQERLREYTVTFDPTGGNMEDPTTVWIGYGSKLGELPKCSRAEYQFRGWYTDPQKGEEVTDTTEVKADMKIYAHWHSVKPEKVKVTLGPKIGKLPQISFKTYLNNVSGYEVQYSTTEDYSSDDTVTMPLQDTYKLAKILGGVVKGKIYYVRARAISSEKDSTGNYVYGDWSDSVKL